MRRMQRAGDDSSHSMKIRLGRSGEIKVDNDIDSLNIYTTSEEIYLSLIHI